MLLARGAQMHVHVDKARDDGESGGVNHLEAIGVAPDDTVTDHQIALAVDSRGRVEDPRTADYDVRKRTGALRQPHPRIEHVGAHAASNVTPGTPGAAVCDSLSTS